MEVTEQIQTFQRFIEMHYLAQLLEEVRKGQMFFSVDFVALSKFSPELADLLLEQPEEVIKACELAVTNFDLPATVKNFRIRFQKLPQTHKNFVRNIRSKHINKLLLIEGTVRQKSDVRPQVTSARFECPSCGNVMSILQLDQKFKEPTRCGCGRKGKFRLLSKELVDVQGIVLEEATKDLEGGAQPKRINVLLKNDLVSPMSDKKTNPGTTIQVVGILKEVPIILRSGGQSTKFDLIIECNNVIPLEEDYSNIVLSDEDREEIQTLAKDPKIREKLVESLAPGIYGHTRIKEALCLQFVGGVKKVRQDGVMSRGDIHMLLIGDPGAGKTIHGDSMITLHDGTYCSIRDYVERNFIGNEENCLIDGPQLPTLDRVGKSITQKIVRLWKRKAEQLYKVKTRTGKELICTATNPFFCPILGSIKVTKTADLHLGDWIATPRKINLKTTMQTITLSSFRVIPVSTQFARFLAYVLAEGYASYDPHKSKYVIEFANKDTALVHDFCTIVFDIFNYRPKIYNKDGGCLRAFVMNKKIVEGFHSLAPSLFEGSFYKKIPLCVMQSPLPVVASFLRAFFECDGYVDKNHGVGITLASREMIKQIQHLLLRFGIMSQMHSTEKYATNTQHKIKRTYWKLHIYGGNAQYFEENIGFLSEQKNTLLRTITIKQRNANLDVIPNLSALLKYCRKTLRMTQFDMNIPRTTYQHFERGDRNPSRRSLQHIVDALRARICELLLLHKQANTLSIVQNRQILHASQSEFATFIGCSQSLVSQYELGKVDKIKTFDYTSLKTKVSELLKDETLLCYLNSLALLSESTIFWDKVVSVEPYDSNDPYIYDLEVEETHNFIANGVYVHNSQLLKRSAVVAPKARFVSGKGVSGAGLTAAVVKDEFLSGWSLEAGAMVLSNKGILMIDEMDKMTDEDRSAMHEGMEQQTVSISKANIQATLRCETTVLAAANPKFGRFDPYETISKQINLPPALINRFDLIFTIKDLPDKEKDEALATFILELHKQHETKTVPIETDKLRKYLIYARQLMKPKLTDEAVKELKEYYVRMRTSGGSDEKGIQAIPISPRQLEALVRLSEACAKLRLSDTVTTDDSKYAIALFHYCLEQVGLDPETGKIDIDRISTGITTSERAKLVGVREIITELEKTTGNKVIPIEQVIAAAQEKGLNEDKVLESIQKLKRSGDLFEPRKGHISRI